MQYFPKVRIYYDLVTCIFVEIPVLSGPQKNRTYSHSTNSVVFKRRIANRKVKNQGEFFSKISSFF